MKWWSGPRLWLLPALAVVFLLLANGLVFYATTESQVDENAKVSSSQRVLSMLDRLRADVVDAETGQRGYLLTGQNSYLAPYTAAKTAIGPLLTTLKTTIQDNPAQVSNLPVLAKLVDTKLSELQSTINVYRTKGATAALRLVTAGTGKSEMDRIRSLLGAMQQAEITLLNARRDDVTKAVWTTRVTLVLATVIDVVLLTGLILLLQRNTDRAARVAEERSELLEREQTARSDAEHERHAALIERARLETFFEAMTDAVVIYDPHGAILQTNAAMRTLFALDDEQSVLRLSVSDRAVAWALRDPKGTPLPPEQWPVRRLLAGTVLTGERSVDMLVRKFDGRDVLVNTTGAPIFGADGALRGAICVFHDETERRYLEQAVRIERDTLRQVLDILPEAVLVADTTPRFLVSNQAARAILGVDVVGQMLQESRTGDPSSYIAWHLDGTPFPSDDLPLERSIFKGEIVQGMQYLVRSALTGGDVPVLANSAPIRDTDGSILGGVVVFQDISALKNLEQQKNDFLATIAHDLKNPLTVIMGLAQVLLRRTNRPEPLDVPRFQEGLSTIDRTARNMAQLVSELLDSSRLQMGQALNLDLQQLDLVELMDETVVEYGQSSQRHKVGFATELSHLLCRCDRARVQRAVANVLTNAIKYSPRGGTITVALASDSAGASPDDTGFATIVVSDHGMGIPSEDIPRIFERFYRASNVGRIPGTGIGLAGVRQIVEQHGGTIAVESKQGEGTTVTIRLPLAGPPEQGDQKE
jgi:signal transduction histidine kinase/CHASE3 domain sensor protein